jgi:TldD protein
MSNLATADELFFQRAGLDRARLESLVDDALGGADDGELFLEYRQSEGLSFDDGVLKAASFDTTQGFGLRAIAGEAAGYAHSSELSEAAVGRAAETVKAVKTADIDAYARGKETRVRQVMASLAGEWQAVEILRAGGERSADVRPLVRLNVSVVVGQGERMESGSYGGGGRISYTRLIEPGYWQAAVDEALRQALVNLESSSSAPAGPASCSTKPSATASRATSTASRPRPSPA